MQTMMLKTNGEGFAAAKQHAARAFLKYLTFPGLAKEDRETVENGVLSLIPPPQPMTQHPEQFQQQSMQNQAQPTLQSGAASAARSKAAKKKRPRVITE